ncbi:MAG TPA: 1-deoxy-D-xylulose-5-phosphate synthase [Ruminococcaceae bacterium]|nr:1-deoxy-D-xylulose-5-phosphate synthase [Oscillospiraceae bacterium]
MILEKINKPNDIKALDPIEYNQLADEIRQFLIENISKTGGHLASNLGVVELTMALHLVFNLPQDKLIWDVGHQAYTHKILTGRKNQFDQLRKFGGMSGFPKRNESHYDAFDTGHSSTSISAGLGYVSARDIKKEHYSVISVIGDGALTGGMAYEALNNASQVKGNFIIVLNDNNMSISKNVGGVSKMLGEIRASNSYYDLKEGVTNTLYKMPMGSVIVDKIKKTKSNIKQLIVPNQMFEGMGITYLGPVDGHDIEKLIKIFKVAKRIDHAVLVHVVTQKGHGYRPAERNPSKYHGIAPFDIKTGNVLKNENGKSYSEVFSEAVCKLAKKDAKIAAITAAMPDGTGLAKFSRWYPERFFDVGIAEQHAVTFSGGLARGGMVPIFAVYSTFLQRAYDQLIHDVSMQGLKVILAVDRAGFVGEDGESHQGIFDTSYLNSVPGWTVYAPTYYAELCSMLYQAIYVDPGAVAIRYPRGGEPTPPEGYQYEKEPFRIFGDPGAKRCLVTYGRLFDTCLQAIGELDDTFVIKLNRIRPIAPEAVAAAAKAQAIWFYEEATVSGGVGQTFAALLEEKGGNARFFHKAVPDTFVKQASVDSQLRKFGLDKASIVSEVNHAEENPA